MIAVIRGVGRRAVAVARYQGQLVQLTGEVLRSVAGGKFRWRLFLDQIASIGFRSQFVVMITGGFTGAVFAAQSFFKFNEIGLASATGPVVAVAMCRELGPVLTGFMIAGRVGAAMAAEIASMRVTEQVDALRSLGVAPVDYLVVPRILATVVSMPILVAESILVGILAADILVVRIFDVPAVWFRTQMMEAVTRGDVLTGLIKAAVFGYLIVMISCHHGLRTGTGAAGVGTATTRAVVDSCIAILIVNFFLTLILNEWLPAFSIQF